MGAKKKPRGKPWCETFLKAISVRRRQIESDPAGKDPHAPGAKLDAGKPRAGLVLGGFALALKAVAQVGTYGAEKYSPGGWERVELGRERYTDALCRHLLEELSGRTLDEDSGLLHSAQVAWNALARLELQLRDAKGKETRP
jgi:hypothetical protein